VGAVGAAMRIVGGRHRGRPLQAPQGRDVRPTSDRTRESLFNIVQHSAWGTDGADPVADAIVLDAFCGTGALGLEALSRGAAEILFLDRSRESLALARDNAAMLGEEERCRFAAGDATNPPPGPALRQTDGQPATLVLLDPPYGQDLITPALTGLTRAGWIAAGALICAELEVRAALVPPAGFSILDERRYRLTRLVFLRFGTVGPT
jgi:16S rRNA (guanine966-N2)-methyltransferase